MFLGIALGVLDVVFVGSVYLYRRPQTHESSVPTFITKITYCCRTEQRSLWAHLTLYIGNLYEGGITNPNTQNPPYTVYYQFGGKRIGMRLANQLGPNRNGQYRIVGDHLGSTLMRRLD
jgi:hypothetical protein